MTIIPPPPPPLILNFYDELCDGSSTVGILTVPCHGWSRVQIPVEPRDFYFCFLQNLQICSVALPGYYSMGIRFFLGEGL
jgi:hypothetical protein